MKIFIVLQITFFCLACGQNFNVGVGISDVTGPAANTNMMMYANLGHLTRGIHLRLYSRAFIFSAVGSSPVVFVNVEIGMISQLIKKKVLLKLNAAFGNLYTDKNVMLSATHTHSGPGGYDQYFLYQFPNLGFIQQSFDAIVTGIVKSIKMAHYNRKPADLLLNQGNLLGASVNRSPLSYMNNPEWERRRYAHDVDTEMVLLKIRDSRGEDMGLINWFPVHAVSMNSSNFLISSDNKGYASIRFEEDFNEFPGEGPFVAAFAQSNEGDVSPNTRGPRCIHDGNPCHNLTNLCSDGSTMKCIAFGPGADMFESTRLIGESQFIKARDLYNSATKILWGRVDSRLKYVNMTNLDVRINSTHMTKTCKPAMGYSFAAGTSDGFGALMFYQGDTEGTSFFNSVRNVLTTPSPELIECQKPKPILLPTGEMKAPFAWQPEIVDYQIFQIGQLVIVGVPAEYTTMAGRRMKEMVYKVMRSYGCPADTKVLLAGLANTYSSYVATYEEYQIQRYEGASTIYGPHTLQAAMNAVKGMALAMVKRRPVYKGTPPPNLKDKKLSIVSPMASAPYDMTPPGVNFGQVLEHVKAAYKPGERVSVTFAAGNPNNDIKLGKTFLTVEKLRLDGIWKVIRKDSNWDTRFYWDGGLITGISNATITWDIPEYQSDGVFRIRHFGTSRTAQGIKPYTGTSFIFQV